MFKLLRLAILALVGYAAYQFVMGMMQLTEQERMPRQARGRQGQARGRGSRSGGRSGGNRGGAGGTGGGARMTAAARAGGQGKQETTQNPDGGTVRHRVGRGVV